MCYLMIAFGNVTTILPVLYSFILFKRLKILFLCLLCSRSKALIRVSVFTLCLQST